MAEKKSIYEEALLDIKTIKEALNANTKEILRSVAKEEINGLVKESLMEDDYEEVAVDDETGEETSELPAELGASDGDMEMGDEAGEAPIALDGEETDGSEFETSDEVGQDDQDLGMDADAFGGDELDMTAASDDDVIAIYKKLSGEDEIEIVGDDIHLTITEPGEYIVKKGGVGATDDAGMGDMDAAGEEDELDYEIAMGDDSDEEMTDDAMGADDSIESDVTMDEPAETDDASEPAFGDDEEVEATDDTEDEEEPIAESTEVSEGDEISEEETEDEEVVEEQIPVGTAQARRVPGKTDLGQPKGAGAASLKESRIMVSELQNRYKKTLTEATQLKAENEEFRKALKKFRTMLVETVVFNSNLSYVTKLFMEHSTTKDEKKKIIKRFDEEVTNLKESKKLYKSIINELSSRKPISESVENKIIKEVTTSSSKQLNEATAYVDPSTQRILDLINRVENK